MSVARLYFDLASPYAYLAVARARAVLGREPLLEPVLVGAIFAKRGWGSWAHTDERGPRVAEIEARAARYGLPPLRWPREWPANALTAMRAAVWADREGRLEPFARAVYDREFAAGADITDLEVLAAAAREAGLDASRLAPAVADPAVKAELRERTEAAWDAGVRGVPTVRIGDAAFFGDDRLEEAAAVASAHSPMR